MPFFFWLYHLFFFFLENSYSTVSCTVRTLTVVPPCCIQCLGELTPTLFSLGLWPPHIFTCFARVIRELNQSFGKTPTAHNDRSFYSHSPPTFELPLTSHFWWVTINQIKIEKMQFGGSTQNVPWFWKDTNRFATKGSRTYKRWTPEQVLFPSYFTFFFENMAIIRISANANFFLAGPLHKIIFM